MTPPTLLPQRKTFYRFFFSFPFHKDGLGEGGGLYIEVLKAKMSLPWDIAMVLLNWKLTSTHCVLPISGRCATKLMAEMGVTVMNR